MNISDRQTEIVSFASQFLYSKYESNLSRIKEDYNANKNTIIAAFTNAIDKLTLLAEHQQESGAKKEITYLVIAYLQSSIITKTYDLQLSLYNDLLYLDPIDTSVFWTPHFVYSHYERDWDEFSRVAAKNFVQLNLHEISNLRLRHAILYHGIVCSIVNDFVLNVLRESGIGKLMLSNEFFILFGGYIDNTTNLGVLRREELHK